MRGGAATSQSPASHAAAHQAGDCFVATLLAMTEPTRAMFETRRTTPPLPVMLGIFSRFIVHILAASAISVRHLGFSGTDIRHRVSAGVSHNLTEQIAGPEPAAVTSGAGATAACSIFDASTVAGAPVTRPPLAETPPSLILLYQIEMNAILDRQHQAGKATPGTEIDCSFRLALPQPAQLQTVGDMACPQHRNITRADEIDRSVPPTQQFGIALQRRGRLLWKRCGIHALAIRQAGCGPKPKRLA